jgi:hypothetical protein
MLASGLTPELLLETLQHNSTLHHSRSGKMLWWV